MPDRILSFFLSLLFISTIPSDFCTPFDTFFCALKKFTDYKNSIICSLLEILTWNTEYLLAEYLFCLEDTLGALHE